MLKRRRFLAGTALAMSPSIVRAQQETTLKVIPQIDLTFLDPHFTTAYVTRNHGYMVYDTLYGQNGKFETSPQMVEGHTIENDGLRWRLKLREGLLWHDGQPVLARDCVASINRWAKRDAFGTELVAVTDELSAPDDRTIQFRLKRPFPLLPDALGKVGSPMAAMMPERLAVTDAFKALTEVVGSGPFQFKADERVPGSRNVYQRFAQYRPRDSGVPDWTAGPKIVHFDRVVWTTIPDFSTCAAALQTGEQDYWEEVLIDLITTLKANPKVRVVNHDTTGIVEMMRLNQLHPPFDNPRIRRALLGAIDQTEYMQSIVGDDRTMYHVPLGVFAPGTPMASEVGLEPLEGKRDFDKVNREIEAAGYNGEKVVMLVQTDFATGKPFGDITANILKRIGVNVDYVATDWGTVLQRRTSREPVDKGGWSIFFSGFSGFDWLNPAADVTIRGNGDAPSAWPGWAVMPKVEQLRHDWFAAADIASQRKVCEAIQAQCMIDVPIIPLGQYQQPMAHRSDIVDVLDGFATFWNLRRA